MKQSSPKPRFFATPAQFRAWLHKHHATKCELLVGFYKTGSGRPSITWPESVDEALCVGWIDGVRKSHDAESYTIRFSPRRPSSNWSAVNIRKMAALIQQGRVLPAGRQAFEARSAKKSAVYSYEQRYQAKFDAESLQLFRANLAAWDYFQSQPPGYRALTTFWVASAKKQETRLKRLRELIAASALKQPIPGLQRTPTRRSTS